MLKRVLFCVLFLAQPAFGQSLDLNRILQTHILPGFDQLASTTQVLERVSATQCTPDAGVLKEVYGEAFDAWIGVSHLRFGPTEADNRAFALAYWPDPRGATPRTLNQLIADKDPVIETLESFQTVSIAGRGFYALDALLYDPAFTALSDDPYYCALVQIIARDIADNAAKIASDWNGEYGQLFVSANNALYQTPADAERIIFSALMSGLEFTSDVRLARPLGTFDRPRPMRAEARRSGRSLRHVTLSLIAMWELASLVSDNDPELAAGFEFAMRATWDMDDPVFAGVSEPQARFRIEVLREWVDRIRRHLSTKTAPSLGIATGFNALDGD